MKKMLISTAMVAGILVLGGGFYLWPKGDPVTSNQTASSSVVKHKTTKKAVAKQVASAEESTTTASKAESTSSSRTEASGSSDASTTSSTGSLSSSAVGSSSSSEVSQALSKSNLTTAQVNDWAWTQVKRQYSGADVTKQDFQFNQYQRNGIVYVDVYENQNDQVAHLAGRFRVNAAGNLEQQSLSNGSSWHVVASAPAE